MGIAEQASPEIDRLILGVHRRVGPKHGDRLGAMARDIGLDSLGLLPSFTGFLLDGLLTKEIALLRMRYRAPEEVTSWLQELEDKGQVENNGGKLRAADTMRPLLKAMESAVADVAFDLWAGQEVAVSVATEASRAMAAAITPEHVVAEAHAKVREPIDRYKLLEQRLVTLRYIRQHDHAAAWIDRNLSAREIVVLTKLWHDESVEDAEETLTKLREAGHIRESGEPKLSPTGKKVRKAIEDDTNASSDRAFDVLGDEQSERFLEALRRLPG